MTKDNRRAASPVQAGIDPLVAEIEAGLEGVTPGERKWQYDNDLGFWHLMPGILIADGRDGTPGGDKIDKANARFAELASPDNIAKLIAGYRSQAERIAALEVERDTAWSDSEHDKESALSAERLGREYLDRAIAAESLLAEAREALEPFASAKGHFDGHVRDDDTVSIALRHIRAHHVRAAARACATLSRLKTGEKGGGE